MTTTVGMRDLVRNSNILQDYDYVDIEDKKTHEYKGLLISPRYADEIRKLLEQKILNEKQKEIDEIMQFSGIADGDTENMTAKEMRAAHAAKFGNA
ncbi:hypothetical protein [Sulfurovum sp. NBC37-1]|uniref:hypothetical protein n=1 Tax=Sulfurovum sp. (strain NBC37-1) TaxID=387093 RepID=UPI0001587B6C|nr:hypothetical protein [Sulfurovum sp. NBC37-1]BAF72497.1 conserved hypothetical protein [Sulfurovum sp. NBC37-1]